MSLLNRVGITQQVTGVTPSQVGGFQTPATRPSTVTPAGDSSTLSKLSGSVPPVDFDLQQILAGVMLRQLPQTASASQGQASSASLPTPNFREVTNLQGVPPVSRAFASQAIGFSAPGIMVNR